MDARNSASDDVTSLRELSKQEGQSPGFWREEIVDLVPVLVLEATCNIVVVGRWRRATVAPRIVSRAPVLSPKQPHIASIPPQSCAGPGHKVTNGALVWPIILSPWTACVDLAGRHIAATPTQENPIDRPYLDRRRGRPVGQLNAPAEHCRDLVTEVMGSCASTLAVNRGPSTRQRTRDRSEFRYGEFVRGVLLAEGIAPDEGQASYSNGILEVRNPGLMRR